jgi:hypothetical protein
MNSEPKRFAKAEQNARQTAARVAALSLIIHGLFERLLLAGVLDPGDLDRIQDFAVTIAADFAQRVNAGIGAEIRSELTSFFDAMFVSAVHETH